MPSCPRALAFASILALIAVALPGAVAADDEAYNVVLLKQISDYQGVNDCWGYTAPGGTELAIYGHKEGTSFVDATDPVNSTEVWNLAGPTSTWRDIKTYLNYAYIVTEGTGPGTGLQIVDLTDPLNPVHVGTYTADAFTSAHNIWIDTGAGVAYACGADGGGMHILSLADPENPVQLDYFSAYYIHDLYVGDGRAYAGAINSGTMRVIDVSNPADPITLATHHYPNAFTHTAWPFLGQTHVATADENEGGHLQIWDITNLANIQFVSEAFAPGGAIIHNIFGVDEILYCSWYSAGTRIFDVSDPADPVEVGFYDTSNRTGGGFGGDWGIYPYRGDGVIYASDRQRGLFIMDFVGGYAGLVEGVVQDGQTNLPLDGARLDFVETPLQLETAVDGSFDGRLSSGTYDVITTKFGFAPDTSQVVITEFGNTVHDVTMLPLPTGVVEVTVLGPGAVPVEGANVDVADSPYQGLVTDASGMVVLDALPVGLPWSVRAARFGFKLTELVVVASATLTEQVQVNLQAGFHDTFDVNQAWIVGQPSDTATDGLWERAVPVPSFYLGQVGPGDDATPSGDGFAYVTESHVEGSFVGSSDVDGGVTTLLTPVFDATSLSDYTLRYTRWFSNRAPSQDIDEFRVDVSTDAGSSWLNLETVATTNEAWSEVTIDLGQFFVPTATMQLRFQAEDVNVPTYVEAGLDDVSLGITGAVDAPEIGGGAVAPRPTIAFAGPNPFRSRTTLELALPTSGAATLAVYDVSGRKVATLLEASRLGAGKHRVVWDGTDDAGARVAPGVYFARAATVDGDASRKVTFIR
jgi:choice-of-anchor B domain-containing protein